MFKAQEEIIRKIASSCNTDSIVRLNWLTEIQDNSEGLNKLNKGTQDLKLRLDKSQEIFEKKLGKVNDCLAKQKEKHKKDINEFSNDND